MPGSLIFVWTGNLKFSPVPQHPAKIYRSKKIQFDKDHIWQLFFEKDTPHCARRSGANRIRMISFGDCMFHDEE